MAVNECVLASFTLLFLMNVQLSHDKMHIAGSSLMGVSKDGSGEQNHGSPQVSLGYFMHC